MLFVVCFCCCSVFTPTNTFLIVGFSMRKFEVLKVFMVVLSLLIQYMLLLSLNILLFLLYSK